MRRGVLVIVDVFRLLGCINSSLNQKIEWHSSYGSYKLDLITYLSLDNKLRYCDTNPDLTCIIGKDRAFQNAKQLENSTHYPSRLLKFHWIARLLSVVQDPLSYILYLDMDALFIDANIDIIDHFRQISSRSDIFISSDIKISQERFQTGVILIRCGNVTNALFQHFNALSVAANISSTYFSDQHIFNDVVVCKKTPVRFFQDGKYSHSQHLCSLPKGTHRLDLEIVKVSRVMFNSFPSLSEPWSQMGWPAGDEDLNNSLIVHFAGSSS